MLSLLQKSLEKMFKNWQIFEKPTILDLAGFWENLNNFINLFLLLFITENLLKWKNKG